MSLAKSIVYLALNVLVKGLADTWRLGGCAAAPYSMACIRLATASLFLTGLDWSTIGSDGSVTLVFEESMALDTRLNKFRSCLNDLLEVLDK